MTTMIRLDAITSRLPVRKVTAAGVARLCKSIKERGFLENYPITVQQKDDGTYELIDGGHRADAAQAEGLTEVPTIIKTGMTQETAFRFAFDSNTASEEYVPNTLVTYAEFVWARAKDGYKQEQIAAMLGWSRELISKFVALRKISHSAWHLIVTTFQIELVGDEESVVRNVGTIVPFTEGLLRSILDLRAPQQIELVTKLASADINKGRFKALAEAYQARNQMKQHALKQLGDIGYALVKRCMKEIDKGNYDQEWKETKGDGSSARLAKLVESIRADWQEQHSVQLLHGDFYELVKTIGDASIDLILTDPPYNISNEREFSLAGRTNISQDFGTWDKIAHENFIHQFSLWAHEYARLLRDGGAGYVFCADRYLSHLWDALEASGLVVKTAFAWHKSNPGTQVMKTTFRSSVEYVLYFTKGPTKTFQWLGQNEMHNFIELPICAGKERLTAAKGETLHPTQKPEALIRHFLEISSVPGDTVFDGFAGVGTVPAVCKATGRKCIAIEQDNTFFEAMQWRVMGHAETRAA